MGLAPEGPRSRCLQLVMATSSTTLHGAAALSAATPDSPALHAISASLTRRENLFEVGRAAGLEPLAAKGLELLTRHRPRPGAPSPRAREIELPRDRPDGLPAVPDEPPVSALNSLVNARHLRLAPSKLRSMRYRFINVDGLKIFCRGAGARHVAGAAAPRMSHVVPHVSRPDQRT
jgi:hypothetical protein